MTNKTNYRTPQPTLDIQKQLEGICETINNSIGISCEIKGWWIWVDGKPTTTQERLLRDMSFFQAKKGKNAGKWYYKHPMAPRTYYKRGLNAKSKKSEKKTEKQKPAFNVGFSDKTKRQILVDEIASVERMMQVDSGENYINLKKMLVDAQQALAKFDGESVKPTEESTEDTTPDIHYQEKTSTPSAEDLKKFFGN